MKILRTGLDVTPLDDMRGVTEASTIGLAPGERPAFLGIIDPETSVARILNLISVDDTGALTYQAPSGYEIVVLND